MLGQYGPVFLIAFITVFTLLIYKHIHHKISTRYGLSMFSKTFGRVLILLIAFIFTLLLWPGLNDNTVQVAVLVFGGLLTLFSSTIIANGMAGILLRHIKQFKVNDIIKFGDEVGRVTETGLFHTEFQNASRHLITIPNSFLVSNSFKKLNYGGTTIHSCVSIGYDVSRQDVEDLMLEAARRVGLEDPNVLVRKLHDYSIIYELYGLMKSSETFVTATSNLNKAILDAFNGAGVEITSPTVMNTRAFDSAHRFTANVPSDSNDGFDQNLDHILFEKARRNAAIESKRHLLTALVQEAASMKEELHATEEEVRKLPDSIDLQEGAQSSRLELMKDRFAELNVRIESLKREINNLDSVSTE